MSAGVISLDDKYALRSGRALLSGTQALVRLLLVQRARDVAAGLDTAGFVSGYRGSPLGGLDQQLWRAQRHLDAAKVRFEPGVNEDLAATAIWGTQQVPLLPGARVDGVFSLWYGKGPGVDRSGDAIKHGNRMGSSPHGGVVLAFGDDHAGKSSTVAYQSEQALVAAGVPILYPASVQDYLDLGLHAWALSRFAGVWAGFKCVNDTVETTATVDIGLDRVSVVVPEGLERPPGGWHARIAFDPLGDDIRLQRYKLPAVHAYARANGLDAIIAGRASAPLAIVAPGKSALDVLGALALLGIDASHAADSGIAVYRPALVWPLEPQALREFARGARELLVIEEKAAFLEPQIAAALYNLPAADRPRLIGKRDERGDEVFASDIAIDASDIAIVIAQRLAALGLARREIDTAAARLRERREHDARRAASLVARPPYFCSGCPHNTSTRVPAESLAFAGIGCHTMALGMERNTLPPTQMGGEGLTWTGIAPFTTTKHVFQNLGDGTYFHSGLLAIRAAVAARVNMTYKILVNDAVAMTGGQPVEGQLSPIEISRQLAAERVKRIALVSDDVRRWRDQASSFAPGVTFHDRRELERVQRELRELPGVTAILYEQTCAAEKRRRRKRATFPDPDRRVFINAAVCEGCGDCSVKSNCVSIEPLETPLGRKRRIDQSGCNKDYSCVEGFCPSFVIIEGARLRKPAAAEVPAERFACLPEPPVVDGDFGALIAGVGGTGVVTIGALLSMAAHLEGRSAAVFDMTGLAQKGGAVASHLRVGARDAAGARDARGIGDRLPAMLRAGEADLVLGCDLVVTAGNDALRVAGPRTRAVLNTDVAPVSQFQRDRDFDFHRNELLERVRAALATDAVHEIDAMAVARQWIGDSIATNLVMTGYASQAGWLPVAPRSIEAAIELNATAVDANRLAFRLGRLLRHEPCAVLPAERAVQDSEPLAGAAMTKPLAEMPFAAMPLAELPLAQLTLDELIAHRVEWLTAYQDAAYAQRYLARVERLRGIEADRCASDALTRAVAHSYARLLAYKDEYEVARLHGSADFAAALRRQFSSGGAPRVLLAPPLFARRDPLTGEPRKREFGAWMLRAMRVLVPLRRLRGTRFDPFGYTHERRAERALIAEYEQALERIAAGLNGATHADAVEIASATDAIRGFGHVKARAAASVLPRWRERVAAFASP